MQVIHEMQAQPWGADVSPEYVHAIVDVVTHPDEGMLTLKQISLGRRMHNT